MVLMRPAHAGLLGHLVGVDGVDLEAQIDDAGLALVGEAVPHLFGRVRGVEEVSRSRTGGKEGLVALEERPHVAGDEVGRIHEVGGADGLRPKAQVADGEDPGLLRVIDEVALDVVVGVLADDLDGVLVGPDGAVGAQAVEEGAKDPRLLASEAFVGGEARVSEVVL